ncbi:4'-phosphopantetheinyl transferase superfamily protein [Flavobacterium sp.]|uniref:4'-phosphopantetheinyl transferase family protein n=1 Tax=Flavobacterium sp. TaxID=239 RepID=UPI0026222B91|nr:4'-phosphopantetheinyl transferase superfamily protein [Flavobacterium sp.]MDG2431369.1 4'-phosphopantetheinyl transferase superfamily protein [Flavobacterium sp.]
MIGNDVIDLALARKQSNWQRSGFLEKIFTVREQLLIKSSTNPELVVWNLWSRKEAAYKIFNRTTGTRAFIPRELECAYTNENEGLVICRGNCFFTKTCIEDDLLYTIAVTKLSHLEAITPILNKDLIIKIDGIPFVSYPDATQLHVASVSNHGRYYKAITIQ